LAKKLRHLLPLWHNGALLIFQMLEAVTEVDLQIHLQTRVSATDDIPIVVKLT
jgi:hypothetical protein